MTIDIANSCSEETVLFVSDCRHRDSLLDVTVAIATLGRLARALAIHVCLSLWESLLTVICGTLDKTDRLSSNSLTVAVVLVSDHFNHCYVVSDRRHCDLSYDRHCGSCRRLSDRRKCASKLASSKTHKHNTKRRQLPNPATQTKEAPKHQTAIAQISYRPDSSTHKPTNT